MKRPDREDILLVAFIVSTVLIFLVLFWATVISEEYQFALKERRDIVSEINGYRLTKREMPVELWIRLRDFNQKVIDHQEQCRGGLWDRMNVAEQWKDIHQIPIPPEIMVGGQYVTE